MHYYNLKDTNSSLECFRDTMLAHEEKFSELQMKDIIDGVTREVLNKYPHMAHGHASNLAREVTDRLVKERGFEYFSPPAYLQVPMGEVINRVLRSPVKVVY